MLTKTTVQSGLTSIDENGNIQLNKPKLLIVNDFCEEANNLFTLGFNNIKNDAQPFIPILIDSFGGDVLTLFSMLDMIDSSEKPVLTCCTSKAMSCGSALLSAGTKGYRFASPRATILIHEASTQLEGKAADIISDAKNMEALNEKLMELLAKNSNRPASFYKNLIKKGNNADLYLTAEEALDCGIIDKIGIPEIEMTVKAEYSLNVVGAKQKPAQKLNKAPRKPKAQSKP
jgi:ATP-dependent Clp endopeptidase proteolytic subunit ClpP